MTNYADYEDNPWSEDSDEGYHEEDYELDEVALAEMKSKLSDENFDDIDLYEKKLEETNEEEYEYDEVVGGRDKKPILSALNKKKLSKYEMDELFNKLGEY